MAFITPNTSFIAHCTNIFPWCTKLALVTISYRNLLSLTIQMIISKLPSRTDNKLQELQRVFITF